MESFPHLRELSLTRSRERERGRERGREREREAGRTSTIRSVGTRPSRLKREGSDLFLVLEIAFQTERLMKRGPWARDREWGERGDMQTHG